MKQIFGIYDCDTGEYFNNSSNTNHFEDKDLIIDYAGVIEKGIKEITSLYHKHGRSITEYLKGFYVAVIYDKNMKDINVFQDRTTSPLTFYYTFCKGKVYFGTSIKKLLLSSNIERKLNEKALGDFLTNGFIYGNETLLENVYKIDAFKGLHIENDLIEQFSVEYSFKEYSQAEALGKWKETLIEAIRSCFYGKDEISLPLSSGYDSNFIAYVASTYENKPINAFSVGGKTGKNEIPIVKDNASSYRNLSLFTALTDERSLERFPDIVWRLEGSVYESGIFLQYELAKLVSEYGIHDLICGECADQIMNLYYLDHSRININKGSEPVYYEFSEYPYIFGSYLILKKNGILANSFDIDTEYPYLNDEFVSVANALRNINQKDKRIHVTTCRELLPEKVVKNMSKIGGSTEVQSLFGNADEVERFISRVESSGFYNEHKDIFEKFSQAAKERQAGITQLKTKIRNTLMDFLHLNVESRKKDAYFYRELRLRESLLYVYLSLFNKLFISGEFDSVMDSESLNVDLKDIM